MKNLGFTLIELLIVIAIILILISIALPNFLEAQVRAKITNAMGEMRSIESAISAYYQDWKRYPQDGFELTGISGYYPEENPRIWVQLTSPIKYFSTIPQDEFHSAYKDTNNLQRSEKHQTYRYYAAWWRCEALGGTPVPKSEKCTKAPTYETDFLGKWIIWSPGPNRVHDFGEWAMYKPWFQAGYAPEVTKAKSAPVYSATNGTVSSGDLVKWGS